MTKLKQLEDLVKEHYKITERLYLKELYAKQTHRDTIVALGSAKTELEWVLEKIGEVK